MTRSKTRSTQSSLERSVVTYARDSNKEKTCVCSSKLRPRSRFTLYLSQAFVSCLGCQQSISDWLGKLKPNKLLSGCQNELKGGGGGQLKRPRIRAGGFYFFRDFAARSRALRMQILRLCRSWVQLDKTAMLRRLHLDHLVNPLSVRRPVKVCRGQAANISNLYSPEYP